MEKLNIVIPYDEIDLLVALFEVTQKDIFKDEEKLESRFKELFSEIKNLIPENQEDAIKEIAELNRMSVDDLSKSPDYNRLCAEYSKGLYIKAVREMAKKLEVTEKQAWALVAWCQDLF